MRNRYDRLTPDELRDSIRDLGLTFGQFARLAGTQRRRVLLWINDTEDIPHGVHVIVTLLALPNAMEIARQLADDWIVERETEEESDMPGP